MSSAPLLSITASIWMLYGLMTPETGAAGDGTLATARGGGASSSSSSSDSSVDAGAGGRTAGAIGGRARATAAGVIAARGAVDGLGAAATPPGEVSSPTPGARASAADASGVASSAG